MTNQEINMMIAGIKGIPVLVMEDGVYTADGSLIEIDYTKDWGLLGPLSGELGAADWIYYMDDGYHFWGKNIGLSHFEVHDADYKKASCLAYIEEFG
jgi:hypothetical protein